MAASAVGSIAAVAGPSSEPSLEEALGRLKASIAKHAEAGATPTHEAVADLTKAVRELSDHLVTLGGRIDRLEKSAPEWTIRGWEPPPGD